MSAIGNRLVHLHTITEGIGKNYNSVDEFLLVVQFCQQQYQTMYDIAFSKFYSPDFQTWDLDFFHAVFLVALEWNQDILEPIHQNP